MKRKSIITICAITLMLVLSLLVLAACDKNKHEFSSDWKADETSHWHECVTKKHTDTSEKLPHDFNEGEITKEPTEAEEGVKTFTCNTCGYEKTESVAKLAHEHTYSEQWSKDETSHWRAATCEHTSEKKDFAAHTFGEWTETKAPTYTEKGEKQRACTVCSYVDKQDVDVLDAKENGVTFNISPRTYDKTEQGLTAEEYSVKGGTVASVEYKVKGAADAEYSSTAPVNAGEYTVRVKVTGNAEYNDIEATADFTIAKRELFFGQVYLINGTDYTKVRSTSVGPTYYGDGKHEKTNKIDGDKIAITIIFAANEVGADVSCVLSGKDADNYFLSETVKPYLAEA